MKSSWGPGRSIVEVLLHEVPIPEVVSDGKQTGKVTSEEADSCSRMTARKGGLDFAMLQDRRPCEKGVLADRYYLTAAPSFVASHAS